jgi:hypothetical protein
MRSFSIAHFSPGAKQKVPGAKFSNFDFRLDGLANASAHGNNFE